MISPQIAISRVVFGPFEYDHAAGSLQKSGIPIRLQGKPLQLLLVLLDRPGQAISREELQDHLWEGKTFVDFEQGLNSAINKLRQTLGDSADQARYIETLPGRGYRFIAPVQRISTSPVLEMPVRTLLSVEQPEVRRRPRWRFAAGAVLAAATLGGFWVSARFSPRPGAVRTTQFRVLPPAGFWLEGAASRQAFALSPDGTRLAFTAMNSSGAMSVFLRNFESLEPQPVPGMEDAFTLFWSPDGRSLYVTAGGKLLRTEGQRHLLLSDSPPFMFTGAVLNSRQILLSGFQASYLVSSSGGALQPMKQTYLWPQLLPDGKHAVHVRWDAGAGRYRAHVLRLSDFSDTAALFETDSRVLYTASAVTPGAGYLLYVRAGNLLAQPFDPGSLHTTGEAMPVANGVYSFAKTGAADFSVAEKGTIAYLSLVSRTQLAWVDRAGHQVATVGPANTNLKSARLSPDGQHFATAIYDIERGEQDLWTFDLQTNAGRRLSADAALRDAAVWSPDSTKLAFLHQADGNPPQVHVRGLGTKDPEKAMPPADFQTPTDWSPDGRFITFVNTGFPRSENEKQSDVWVFDLARGGKILPLLNTRFNETNPAFSPDGKWLAFTSNDSGRPEVYVQAFHSGDAPGLTGERYLVSNAGAQALRWRRDGRELFYLDLDGCVRAVAVTLFPKPAFGRSIPLFTISTEARAAIHSALGFDVAADGQRFIVPTVTSGQAPSIVVVQGWEATLPHHP